MDKIIEASEGGSRAALPPPYDVNRLWKRWAKAEAEQDALVKAYEAVSDKIPAWARAGPRVLRADGTWSDDCSGWPAIEDATPPAAPMVKVVSPSLYDIRERYDQRASFTRTGKLETEPDLLRAYRQELRLLASRCRKKRAEEKRAGLPELDKRLDAIGDELSQIEDDVFALPDAAPDALVAKALYALTDCDSELLIGDGFCPVREALVSVVRGLRTYARDALAEAADEILAQIKGRQQ